MTTYVHLTCSSLNVSTTFALRPDYRFSEVLRQIKGIWKLRYVEDGKDVVRLRWHGKILEATDTPESVSDFYTLRAGLAGEDLYIG